MPHEYATPRRFAGVEKKVNLFLIAAVLAVLGVVALVSYKQGAFVRHSALYFYAADVFGINKGMAVKLFGLPVGNVKSMVMSDRGVKVELSIDSDYLAHLPKGSRARLLRDGYIGAANIQIIPGTDGTDGNEGTVVAGEVIEFLPNRGVAEVVDDLKNQLTPFLAQMHRMLEELNRPEGSFRKSAGAARDLLQQLPETNQEARRILRDLDRSVLALTPQAQAGFASIARLGAQAEQQLPVLTGKFATTLDSLADAAQQVREQTRRNGESLNEALRLAPALLRDGTDLARNGADLVREGQDVLGAARNVWPLSSVVEARTTRTLPVDSFESAGPGHGPVPAGR